MDRGYRNGTCGSYQLEREPKHCMGNFSRVLRLVLRDLLRDLGLTLLAFLLSFRCNRQRNSYGLLLTFAALHFA